MKRGNIVIVTTRVKGTVIAILPLVAIVVGHIGHNSMAILVAIFIIFHWKNTYLNLSGEGLMKVNHISNLEEIS